MCRSDVLHNAVGLEREACAAFILSQKHEGWSVLPTLYDDGGYSGGTLDRPALQRLLADIADAKVDVVVASAFSSARGLPEKQKVSSPQFLALAWAAANAKAKELGWIAWEN
jgi:hypothetical protein